MTKKYRLRLTCWLGVFVSLVGVACTTEDKDGPSNWTGRGGAAGGMASGGTTNGGGSDPGGASAGWTTGLTNGPNGPIPLVVVDQFGYRPDDPKLALVRDPRTGYDAAVDFTPGATYALIDAATDETVLEGAPSAWN